MKRSFLILMGLCGAVSLTSAHSDRLVAMVEKKPVMESELQDRFTLAKMIDPAYQSASYDSVRQQILEDICLEKMTEVLWERVGFNKVVPSSDQIQSFKNFYHLEALSDKPVTNFYIAKMRENELARVMVQPSIEISELELSAFSKQKQAWQALDAFWTFRLSFSSTKPTEDPVDYKHFEKMPVSKIQPSFFRHVDWKKTNEWQYFKDDGEFVCFYLENIEVPSIATKKFQIELLLLEPNTASTDPNSWAVARSIPLTVKNSTELSVDLWESLMTLSPGGISQACAISDKWYKVKLNSIDIVTDSYDNLITAQFRDVLRQKKTAEKMPSWYSEMKKNFYINMIDAS